MYCTTNPFPELEFFGPHNKQHGARGLVKHYHIRFDPKLGPGTYKMGCIPCACTQCTFTLYKPWYPGVPPHQKPRY